MTATDNGRGIVLPYPVLDSAWRTSGECRPAPTNGLSDTRARAVSHIRSSMVRPRRHGSGHVFGLSLHGSVSLDPRLVVCPLTTRLRASLTDLQTFVPLADIEVDSTPPSTFVLENLRQASRDAMTLLKDSADPLLDVTSDQYVAATESRWEAVLGVLRHERSAGTAKIKGGWAMIRYHWSVPLISPITRRARLLTTSGCAYYFTILGPRMATRSALSF